MTDPIDPFDLNRRLGRGINIIGYDPLWQERKSGRMQARHFRLIREAGFSHVRINLHPFRFMQAASPFAIHPAWLETLDWALAQSLENGLLVVLDMHEFIALAEDPAGLKPKFLAVWRQLAERYRDQPETVLFELLNEPNKALTDALWNEYLKEPLALVRQSNPQRALIIGPAWWNGIDHINQLQLPEAERNLIVTVHYYHPMPFTHQGTAWTEYTDRTNVTWQAAPAEQQAVIRDLSVAQAWSAQYHRPIYLGEFGAYDKADMASRVRYTSFVTRQAEALGWSWAYWQFDSDFIAYDIPHDRWVQPILGALQN
jgi:endoglucanase